MAPSVFVNSGVGVGYTTTNLECDALTKIYSALNGDSWIIKDGWDTVSTSSNCCNGVHGVTCNTNGNIAQILLNRNQLSGQLPDVFHQLPQLTTFEAGSNQLTGPIPSSLADLALLSMLDLSFNQLTGSVPNLSIPEGHCELHANNFHCHVDNLATNCTSDVDLNIVCDVNGLPVLASNLQVGATASNSSSAAAHGLSGFAIAGIAVGALLVVLGAVTPAAVAFRKKMLHEKRLDGTSGSNSPSSYVTEGAAAPAKLSAKEKRKLKQQQQKSSWSFSNIIGRKTTTPAMASSTDEESSDLPESDATTGQSTLAVVTSVATASATTMYSYISSAASEGHKLFTSIAYASPDAAVNGDNSSEQHHDAKAMYSHQTSVARASVPAAGGAAASFAARRSEAPGNRFTTSSAAAKRAASAAKSYRAKVAAARAAASASGGGVIVPARGESMTTTA